MKKTAMMLCLLMSLLAFGAEIPADRTEFTNDLIYEKGEKEPYTGTVVTKGPDGKTLEEKSYKNGRLDGQAKRYDENGKLTMEEYYRNGRREGTRKSYYPDGTVYREDNYDNGRRKGYSRTFFKNGKLQSERSYDNDQIDGVSKGYDLNGTLRLEENYKVGRLDGFVRSYGTDGKLLKETLYRDGVETDIRVPVDRTELKGQILWLKGGPSPFTGIVEFRSAGDDKITMELHYVDGVLSGRQVSYYPDGKTRLESDLQNGEGTVVEYYQNGKLKRKLYFSDMTVSGTEVVYNEDGSEAWQTVWDKGKRSGTRTVTVVNKEKNTTSVALTTEFNADRLQFKNDLIVAAGASTPYTGYIRLWYPNGQSFYEMYAKAGKLEEVSRTWFQNGQLQFEENYKDGLYHGKRTAWFENGVKQSEENYKNGQKDGTWKEWYPSGKLKEETKYANDLKDGSFVVYGENGKKLRQGAFDKGKEEGTFEEYFPDESLKLQETYKAGVLEGKRTEFFEDGNSCVEEFYKEGKLDGERNEFYPNENIHVAEKWIKGNLEGERIVKFEDDTIQVKENYVGGKLDGEMETFNQQGKLLMKASYKAGNLDGILTEYYENSDTPKLVENYLAGKLNGPRKEFYEDKKDKSDALYKDGLLDGRLRTWYENGNRQSEINYEKGKKNGSAEEFFETGEPAKSENYKDDKKDGICKAYYEGGELKSEGNFKKGEGMTRTYYADGMPEKEIDTKFNGENQVDTIRTLSREGNLLTEETRINGLKEGVCITYYPDGNLQKREAFVRDKLNGTSSCYYPDGKIEKREDYADNILNGDAWYYYPDGTVKMQVEWVKNVQGATSYYDEKGNLTVVSTFINGKEERILKWYKNKNYFETPQEKEMRKALYEGIKADPHFAGLMQAIWKEAGFLENEIMTPEDEFASFTLATSNSAGTTPYIAIFNFEKPNKSWINFAIVIPSFTYDNRAGKWTLSFPWSRNSRQHSGQSLSWTRYYDEDKKVFKSLALTEKSGGQWEASLRETDEKNNWLVKGILDLTKGGPTGNCEYGRRLRQEFRYTPMPAQTTTLVFDDHGNGYDPAVEEARASDKTARATILRELYDRYLPGVGLFVFSNRKMEISNFGYLLEQAIVAEGALTPDEIRRFAYERENDPSAVLINSNYNGERIYILQFMKDNGSWVKAAAKTPDPNQKLYPEDTAHLTRIIADDIGDMKSALFRGDGWSGARLELAKTVEKENMILSSDIDLSVKGPVKAPKALPEPSWAKENYTKESPKSFPGPVYRAAELREITGLYIWGGVSPKAENQELRKQVYQGDQ
ncbi:MAG: toxin-antitoxin system YwqK family antitoxin [Fusobacteriaceae bacterium]|nr:toxin-antitoxin system YwqK family antitoxin [Fusobacteriaceae bacterium]